jgi:hypothetical protein
MKNFVLILLLLLVNTTISQSDITKLADDYCSKDSLPVRNYSKDERDDRRSRRQNNWYNDYKQIIRFLTDPENNPEDFFEVVSWEGPLLIVMMILTFLSIIAFFIMCCGACKAKGGNSKVWTVLGCIMFWVFLALFITTLVFFSMSEDIVKNLFCSLYKLPSSSLDGVNDTEIKFIGFSNFKNTMSNLNSEVDNLNNVSANLDKIRIQNLQIKTNDAWTKSIEVYNTYMTKQIVDGEGVYKTPNIALNLVPGVSPVIASDLTQIDGVAEGLNEAALKGREIVGSSATFKTSLSSFSNRLDALVKQLDSASDKYKSSFKIASDYNRVGYGFMIAFGLLTCILMTVLFIILCLNCSKDKCLNCKTCARVIFILIAIFLFIYFILIFIMMVGSVSVSGMCGLVRKFEQDPKTALDQLTEITGMTSEIRLAAETCLVSTGAGNIYDTYKNSDDAVQYNDLIKASRLLTGLSSYRKWKNDTSTATTLKSIEDQKFTWDQYELAIKVDYSNVETKLEELNDLVSCSGTTYVLDKSRCTSDIKTCENIYEPGVVKTVTPPSCATDQAKVTKNFDNLQKYQNEMVGFTNDLQSAVCDDNGTSVQSKYKISKEALIAINDEVTAVENVLPKSLASSKTFNSGLNEMDDCRSLRRIILQFEDEGCIRFNYYLYVFLVVSCVCAMIWFFMLWCLCCALRKTTDEPEREKPVKPVKEEEPDLDVDDKEKMPFY